MAGTDREITVEVVYPLPHDQRVYVVRLPSGGTVADAVVASGLLADYPDLDPGRCVVGVFGERVALTAVVASGDRIEIYRPLIADAKESRRRRAAKRRTTG